MALHTFRVSIGIVTIATAMLLGVANHSASAQPESLPEQNLARGHFHAATFSQTEPFLLTASDHIAQLWEVQTGRLVRQFVGHQASIHSICFSPDGKHVLTGAGNAGVVGRDDPTARIWDVATGEQLAIFKTGGAYVTSAMFSPKANQILTVTRNNTAAGVGDTVALWDADSHKRQFVLLEPPMRCESMAFSPDASTVAGLVVDAGHLRVWSANSGKVSWQVERPRLKSTTPNQRGASLLEFSPDGKRLVASRGDAIATTFDTETGRELQAFQGHTGSLVSAMFCFDGNNVITASTDGTARLWDANSGRQLKQFDHLGSIADMTLSKDGNRLLTKWSSRKTGEFNNSIQWFATLLDVKTYREIKRFTLHSPNNGPYTPVVLSPDGRRLIANVLPDDVVLVDTETGAILRTYE